MDTTATGRALYDELPGPLPAAQIIALNQPKADLHTYRQYEWNGWSFTLPPGVFLPGATSRMVHQRLLDGSIDVRSRSYATMGAGLGVDALVAGQRGAREVYAMDIHPESVRVTEHYYRELVGQRPGTRFVPLVSDLFAELAEATKLDVITFNPPAVSQPVSKDPDVVRNVCVGQPLLARFFAEIASKDLLNTGGEVFVIVSNTADLRGIVGSALDSGFLPEIHYRHEWHDEVRTYLFRFTRAAAG